jgi:peptide/nickel transport system substrate-binding protein
MLLTVWSPPPDPDQYYFWHSTQEVGNITHYKNVRIDKLLEDGRKTLNINERKKIYKDFQRIIMDDHPALFIYYPYSYTIEKK